MSGIIDQKLGFPEARRLRADIIALLPKPNDEDKAQKVLLIQPFIRNEKQTIRDLITERAARFGENVRVGRFVRLELGA